MKGMTMQEKPTRLLVYELAISKFVILAPGPLVDGPFNPTHDPYTYSAVGSWACCSLLVTLRCDRPRRHVMHSYDT
ncbi:hypothetical protein VFPPC_16334 [Pochonia chlamydosporia 170]|uniref:Uncharacterized protein n=1 Tax=Pochonia chlamydosporia 170 TaxID=1380566 RepID=A0A179FIH5_METCM|nr:hypothetical protein VFPPC_16334 [Pochonia chlamydosporia 170]OAQ65332.1 hypothetical protein VFPPC_16334 [Pochonia chlamydosporia 170]